MTSPSASPPVRRAIGSEPSEAFDQPARGFAQGEHQQKGDDDPRYQPAQKLYLMQACHLREGQDPARKLAQGEGDRQRADRGAADDDHREADEHAERGAEQADLVLQGYGAWSLRCPLCAVRPPIRAPSLAALALS